MSAQNNNTAPMVEQKTEQKAEQKAEQSGQAKVQILSAGVQAVRSREFIDLSLWKKSWMWLVVFPFLLSCIYYGVIASDRYVSEAKVTIKQTDSIGQVEAGISLLGATTSPGAQDAKMLQEYLLSLDMLHYLESNQSLRAHYQSGHADMFSRLDEDARQEQFLEFYRDHMEVSYDELSGVLTVRAQAFEADYGQQLLKVILARGEEFINNIGHNMAKEQVGFVQGELNRARESLRTSQHQILTFQDEHKLFNPQQESGARLEIVNSMEASLARLKADLTNRLSYMQDTAVEVVALKDRIRAEEAQLKIERSKLVGDQAGENMNDVNAEFKNLQMNVEFATDNYKTSLLSLEQARIEAYRKLKHLVVVDSPSLAENAEYPRRIYILSTLLVLLCIFYGVGRIVVATVREHRDI